MLVVVCDPVACNQHIIDHARHLCVAQRFQLAEETDVPLGTKHIVFVVHLPPGVEQRQRKYELDPLPPWKYYFVDDVRPDVVDGQPVLNTSVMLNASVHELCVNGLVPLRQLLQTRVQPALAACPTPEVFFFRVKK